MALLTRFEAQGMTADKYATVLQKLAESGMGTPPGRLHHFSFGSENNLQVIDIYDSPESMQALGQKLVPILQELEIEVKPDVQELYKTI